jgi:hypothetical protein
VLQLQELLWSCAGTHPDLTAGVLLPPVLAAILAADGLKRTVDEGAHLVQRLYSTVPPRAAIRPNILAPAAAAVVAASKAINSGSASAQPLSPMACLDSDSLALCFSFLCGCDWFRAMRTCRRWVGLRFKPASWPSSLPCGREVARVVETMTLLLADDATVEAACIGLSPLRADGVRLFIEGGALPRVVELLADRMPQKLQIAALRWCNLMCYAEEGVHAPRMAAEGVLAALLRLVRSSPYESVRTVSIVVIGNSCFGNPAQNPAVIDSGALPIIMDVIRTRAATAVADGGDQNMVDHPAAALACMAFRGTDNDRRALLREGFLPFLCKFTLLYCARSVAGPVPRRLAGEPRYIVDLLAAMRYLLRTAELDLSAGSDSLRSLMVRECGPRLTFEPMLAHWSDRVRDAVVTFQREFYEAQA